MNLDKNSKKADEIANLYRAALYLGLGKKEMALDFLKKAKAESIIKPWDLKNHQKQLFWAEKILDQYHLQRFKFS